MLVLVAGGSAWAPDRYVIDHVEIGAASAYEANRGTASAATASTGGRSPTPPTRSDWPRSTSRDRRRERLRPGDLLRRRRRARRRHALRSAFAKDSSARTSSRSRARSPRTTTRVRDQRRLLRIPRHRHRDPQRRRSTATRAPARAWRSTATDDAGLRRDHHDADQLVADGVWNTLSFGPALVEDGESSPASTRRGRHERRQPLDPGRAAAHRGRRDRRQPLRVRRRRRPQRGLQPGRHDDRARRASSRPAAPPPPTTSTAVGRRPCTSTVPW